MYLNDFMNVRDVTTYEATYVTVVVMPLKNYRYDTSNNLKYCHDIIYKFLFLEVADQWPRYESFLKRRR